MPARSPNGASAATAAVDFSATTDSPVSSASSIRSACACNRRRSAGTRSPASISTTSPGTSAATSATCGAPERSTRAWGVSRSRSADMAASALPSCATPTSALISTTPRITVASTQWPSTAASAAEASRKPISALANWAPKRCSQLCRGGSGKVLGPCSCSRRAASASSSPCRASVRCSSTTREGGRAWGGTGSGAAVG